MKYVRRKIIKGSPYYYFEYTLKPEKGRKITYSKYLGTSLPENLKNNIKDFFF